MGYRRIRISENEITAFRATWPCSWLPTGTDLVAEFAPNGDLVDYRWTDSLCFRTNIDGFALAALIDDGKAGLIGTETR